MEKVVFSGQDEQAVAILKDLIDKGVLRAGVFTSVVFKSQKKALSAYEKVNGTTIVEKVTSGVVRFDINYYNIASVKERMVEGDPKDRTYGELVEGYKNLLIENKGEHLIKVYPLRNATNGKLKTKWYVNGVEVTDKNVIESIIGKAQMKSSGGANEVFNIKAKNLISIGG